MSVQIAVRFGIFWTTNKCRSYCNQIVGENKTTKEGTCQYNSYHTNARKKLDCHWAIRTLVAHNLSKKVICLLRHNQTIQREKDGAIQLYRIKFYLRNHSSQIRHWTDDRWKACLATGGSLKRRFQYCSDWFGKNSSTSVLFKDTLETILFDPTLQDNVVIGTGIFPYVYHDWDWNIPLRLPHWMRVQSSLYYQ